MSCGITDYIIAGNGGGSGKGFIRLICMAIALITALLIISLPGSAQTLSNSNGGDWKYYRDISIINRGGILTDYQVLVNLTDSNFPTLAQPGGADIRFTDAKGNELSYWIENWNDNKDAKIWVKVSIVPGYTTSIIRMYYGNPIAGSSSNGDTTFDFFDDFEDGMIDLVKWQEYDLNGGFGHVTEENGVMKLSLTTEGSYPPVLPSVQSFQDGILEFKGKVISTKNVPHIVGKFRYDGTSSVEITIRGAWFKDLYFYDHGYLGKIIYENLDDHLNEWHFIQVKFSGNSAQVYAKNLVTSSDGSTSSTIATTIANPIGLSVWNSNTADYFDEVRVRKYASSEPTVSVGTETEVAKDFTFVHLTDVHVGYRYLPWSNEMIDSVEHFSDLQQTIKSINPDLVLITGDLVEYDKEDFFMAFKNLLRNPSAPVYTTPGNHDRREYFVLGDDLTDYNKYLNAINNPTKPDDNNYSFYKEGYHFIGLDSGADYNAVLNNYCKLFVDECFNSDFDNATCQNYLAKCKIIDYPPESNGLSDELMARLIGEFKSTAPKIVFMHHPVMSSGNDNVGLPPIPPDGGPGGNDGAIAFNRRNFINYTKDNNVQLVLTGHSHDNAIFDITGQPVLNSSSNRPLFIQTENEAYRIIDVKDGLANPYNTQSVPRLDRISAALSWKNSSVITHDLHAYDSEGNHTGMKECGDDFELGIPDSYYTGNYGGLSFTPQVIVSYSGDTKIKKEIKSFKIFSFCLIKPFSKAQDVPNAITSATPLENSSFNLTIKKQKELFTNEVYFNNINVIESSIATVNVSGVSIYKMDLDLNGDGTIDQVINPDSIYIIPAQPQRNIDLLLYSGIGVINLTTSSGTFPKAASLSDSIPPEKPDFEFPYGLFSFNISGLSTGQRVNITLTLPHNLSTSAKYWNYGWIIDNVSSYWYQIPVTGNDGDNEIQIQLQDGGIGDEDLLANGVILSTGGPGVPLSDTEMKGSVTGGGWFYADSEGTPQASKAKFEFEVKYQHDKPSGNLEFEQKDEDIKLKSKSIDWFGINDGSIRFQGTGKVDGEGSYNFLVTAKDNGEPGTGTDFFEIIIWNSTDAHENLRLKAGNTLEGGNIAVHENKSHESDLED